MTIDELQRWRRFSSNWLHWSICSLGRGHLGVCMCSRGEVSGVRIWSVCTVGRVCACVFPVHALLHDNVCSRLSAECDNDPCASKGRLGHQPGSVLCGCKEGFVEQHLMSRMTATVWTLADVYQRHCSSELCVFLMFVGALHLAACPTCRYMCWHISWLTP